MEVFQGHSKASQNISTVADMLNFVEKFSEFRLSLSLSCYQSNMCSTA